MSPLGYAVSAFFLVVSTAVATAYLLNHYTP